MILAWDFGEVVGVSIALIIMLGSMLGNALKKKDNQAPVSQATDEETPEVSLDEIAAERRAQLMAEAQKRRQMLAQQRQQRGETQQSQTSRPPTMAERLKQAAPPTREASPRDAQMRQAAAREAERKKQAEAALERRRQMQQRQEQQRLEKRSRQQQANQRSQTQPRHRPAPPTSAQPKREDSPILLDESRRVSIAPVESETAQSSQRPAAKLGGNFSLRQAIIWKEILDPPVALRDPLDSGHA